MSKSLLSTSRTWHRKIASVFFIFFFSISLTGLMLGWKSIFTTVIFDNKAFKPEISLQKWMPMNILENFATKAVNKKTGNHFKHSDKIELKPSSGYIGFAYSKNYNVQVDGATGTVIHIEQKNGSFIQDIHDGAILDKLLPNSPGMSKKIYCSIIGLALFLLTCSGFYLWYKPKKIRESRKKKLDAAVLKSFYIMEFKDR